MNLRLPLYLRRVLAVSMLAALLLVVGEVAVFPLGARYQDATTAIDQAANLLGRYKANIEQKGRIEALIAEQRSVLSGYRGYIDAPNQPLATSTLQTNLRRVLEANGASVRVLSVLPPTREAGFEKLVARAEATLGAERLLELIFALEAAQTPKMAVEALEIRAPDGNGERSPSDRNVSLTLRLDIAAYWVNK